MTYGCWAAAGGEDVDRTEQSPSHASLCPPAMAMQAAPVAPTPCVLGQKRKAAPPVAPPAFGAGVQARRVSAKGQGSLMRARELPAHRRPVRAHGVGQQLVSAHEIAKITLSEAPRGEVLCIDGTYRPYRRRHGSVYVRGDAGIDVLLRR
jgi:hypothetical protein